MVLIVVTCIQKYVIYNFQEVNLPPDAARIASISRRNSSTCRPRVATLRDDFGKRFQPTERQAFEVDPDARHNGFVMLHVRWIIANPAQTGLILPNPHHASQKESLSPEKHGPFHP